MRAALLASATLLAAGTAYAANPWAVSAPGVSAAQSAAIKGAVQANGGSVSATKVLGASSNGGLAPSTAQGLAAKEGERPSIGDFNGSLASEANQYISAMAAASSAGGGVLYFPAAGPNGWGKTNPVPPSNTVLEVDGPFAQPSIGGMSNYMSFGKEWVGAFGSGNTLPSSVVGIGGMLSGSGGASTLSSPGQTAFGIVVQKPSFLNTATAPRGGIGGINIVVRAGGPNDGSSDGFAIQADVGCEAYTGFCAYGENQTRLLDANGNVTQEIDAQLTLLNATTGDSLAGQYTADVGVINDGFQFVSQSTSTYFKKILRDTYIGKDVFWINANGGGLTWQSDGTSATQINLGDVGGVATVTNGSGATLASVDQSGNTAIGGGLDYLNPVAWTTGTTYPIGRRVVYSGEIYRALVAGSGSSTVAPTTANSGATGSDGYNWVALAASTSARLIDPTSGDVRVPGTFYIRSNAASPFDVPFYEISGSPASVYSAPSGSIACRWDGGISRTCYIMESGSATPSTAQWDSIITSSTNAGLSATGTTQAGALVLTARVNEITTSTSTGNGAVLSGTMQDIQTVQVDPAAAYPVQLYPSSGGQIIGTAAVNTPVTVPQGYTASCAYRFAGIRQCTISPPNPNTVSAQSAAYTLAATDCGTMIRDTGTTAHTYTVPTGLPTGCQVDIEQAGAASSNPTTTGLITFAAGTGETLEQAGSGTLTHATTGQFARATVKIDSAATFVIGGQVQ